MTIARARRCALGICAAAGIAAAVASAALISAVVRTPEQVVTAMGKNDIQALLGLITDGVFAAVREIARYL
jgi:F0F1-type ATP synthase membrane subunit c/vacuolar-type H+-ATPase subunit K